MVMARSNSLNVSFNGLLTLSRLELKVRSLMMLQSNLWTPVITRSVADAITNPRYVFAVVACVGRLDGVGCGPLRQIYATRV